MNFPEDIACICGSPVFKKEMSGMFSAECSGCGRSRGPSESMFSLYAEWYDLVPAKIAFEDAMKAMGKIIMRLADSGGHVPASELVDLADGEAVGRRVVNILNDTGLITGMYLVDGKEVSMDDAFEAKREGREVKVYFKKTFRRYTA